MTPTVANVLSVYSNATAAQIREGLAWYVDVHRFALSLDIKIHRAAGVIAALSPMQSWNVNKKQAAKAYQQGNADGLGLTRNCNKATAILFGADPEDILRGDKVTAFYRTIVDPTGDIRPVIDRHAFDIALGRVTDDTTRSLLSSKGVYERFADVYREAAVVAGIGAAQMQAICWVSWRENK